MADDKVTLSVQVDPQVKAALDEAAADRMIGLGRLVEIGLKTFLDDLVPVDELQLRRSGAPIAAAPPSDASD